jgi:HAMP domain-containing protein
MNTTKAVAHRVGQARGLALRAQLAWILTQLVFLLSLIGGVVAVALWARRRLTAGVQAGAAATTPPAPPTDEVTSDTPPTSLR